MRLFTAIDLPEPIRERLADALDQLRPLASLRWTRAVKLHITTKFIGEWESHRLGEIEEVLGGLRQGTSIPIEIKGLGWFPNPHSPRLLWAAVHAPDLPEAARRTEAALARVGVALERRNYHPHLTLARIPPPPPDLAVLRRAIALLPSTEFGSFEAAGFSLYVSELGPDGGRYTRLRSFPL